MQYQKLTKTELQTLSEQLKAHFEKNDQHRDKIVSFVKTYYPAQACLAVITFDSKYNDNTYDVSLSYLAVYDENTNEILPNLATAKVCRSEWGSLFGYDNGSECIAPKEDLIIYLNSDALPEVYKRIV